jgi:hypothetical protein
MNINDFDSLYRERVTALGVTGETVTLQLAKVDPGRIRVITHLAIENKTSAVVRGTLTGTVTGDLIEMHAIGWEMPRGGA